MARVETLQKQTYTDYAEVPWIRKSGTNSLFLVLHLVTCGAIPLLMVTCVVLVTGSVYYNKKAPDGSLMVWSAANKVIAFLLLIPSLLVIGALGIALVGAFLQSIAP